jgi:predicted Fe-Mo cluster-binding NifX family protein
MEIIAITNWNDIISPHYDASCSMIIISASGNQKSFSVKDMTLLEKADLCKKEHVTRIICGAISTVARTLLQEREIAVYAWICGSVHDILKAVNQDVNIYDFYAMPGCNQKICCKKRKGKHSGQLNNSINMHSLSNSMNCRDNRL